MNKENCALKLVDEIILYYDARSKKHQSQSSGLQYQMSDRADIIVTSRMSLSVGWHRDKRAVTLNREMNISFGYLSVGMFLHLQFQRPEHTVLQILIAVSTVDSCRDPRSVQQCLTDACLHRVTPCWVLLGAYCLVLYVDRSEWPYVALAGSPRGCCVTMVTSDKCLLVLTHEPVRK